jgi:hypothetical protein
MQKRGGLAGSGGADDHIPRQLVEAVTAPPLLFERGHSFFEALAQLQSLGRWLCLLGYRLLQHRGHEIVAGLEGAEAFHQPDQKPDANHRGDDVETDGRRVERPVLGKLEQRTGEPDQQGN